MGKLIRARAEHLSGDPACSRRASAFNASWQARSPPERQALDLALFLLGSSSSSNAAPRQRP